MRKRRCPPVLTGAGVSLPVVIPPALGAGAYLSSPLLGQLGTASPVLLVDPLFSPELANLGFTEEDGVLRYAGTEPKRFHVVGNVSVSAESESDSLFILDIAIDGVVAPAPAPGSGHRGRGHGRHQHHHAAVPAAQPRADCRPGAHLDGWFSLRAALGVYRGAGVIG